MEVMTATTVWTRTHAESVLYWTRRLDEATRRIEMTTAPGPGPLRDRCRRREALAQLAKLRAAGPRPTR